MTDEAVRELDRRGPADLDEVERVKLVRAKVLAGDWVVVASVSGGKDSAAMSLYLTELGIPHRRLFADTKWEHPLTYAYLDGPLAEKLGPIERCSGRRGMVDLIRHKGMFPSRTKRFCTQELKVFPLAKYMKQLAEELGVEVVNAVGIRAEESEARSKFLPWEYQETFDCDVWRPILNWSLDDVVAIHRRHGLLPNPLYLQGASRVGCWPCIYAKKDEVRFLSEQDPGKIDFLRDLEQKVTARAAERGDPRYRSFFALWQLGEGTRACAPIDEVVAWSKTASGGRNLALFQPGPEDEGCSKWGLCGVYEPGGWPQDTEEEKREDCSGTEAQEDQQQQRQEGPGPGGQAGADGGVEGEGSGQARQEGVADHVEPGHDQGHPVLPGQGLAVHGHEVPEPLPRQGSLFLEPEAGQ